MQQNHMSNGHVSPPSIGTPRQPRLLYRRGLPDLPELIEAEEEEVITADNVSMNTCSTRHSTSTSASSLQFPTHVAAATSLFKSPNPASQPHRPTQSMHEIYTQTPPDSASRLQTPFEYVASAFRFNPRRYESTPSPPPSPRGETMEYSSREYGLGVNLNDDGHFDVSGSGMVEDGYYQNESGYDNSILEDCPGGHPTSQHHDAQHQSSSSGEVNPSEVGDYISPPSSPGTDCTFPLFWLII